MNQNTYLHKWAPTRVPRVISTRRRGGVEKNQESEELVQIMAAGIRERRTQSRKSFLSFSPRLRASALNQGFLSPVNPLLESKHPMPIQARTSSARSFFSRHGTLSKWHPTYAYRQGAGLSGAGAALGQAHRGIYRHQESTGAALLQGRSLPATALFAAAEGLLHEGAQ